MSDIAQRVEELNTIVERIVKEAADKNDFHNYGEARRVFKAVVTKLGSFEH